MIHFSIITVSFNSGGKLLDTIRSVLNQSYSHFEIIVKDGMSQDGSLDGIDALDSRIRVYRSQDSGIYDAMNQALQYANGDYLLFLNCGDYLYDSDVLQTLAGMIDGDRGNSQLYYGDVYVRSRGGVIYTQKTINNYNLINRTICHQAILFAKSIFQECQYDLTFDYAADMALYVRCIKEKKLAMKHLPMIIVNYEGGGASETIENKKAIIREKHRIMHMYLSKHEACVVEFQRFARLQVLKEIVSTNTVLFGLYERVAALVAKKNYRKYLDQQ